MREARRGRVVVGVGESLAALQALRYAVAEARRLDAALRAVRVWHVSVDRCRVAAGSDAESTIRLSFERAMGGLPGSVDLELIAVEGAVGPTLVAQARTTTTCSFWAHQSGTGGVCLCSRWTVTAPGALPARSWSSLPLCWPENTAARR